MPSSATLTEEETQPLRSTASESSEEAKSNKSFRVSGGKRLIWRDIYAEIKEPTKWFNCCADVDSEPRVVLNQSRELYREF